MNNACEVCGYPSGENDLCLKHEKLLAKRLKNEKEKPKKRKVWPSLSRINLLTR